MSIRWYGLDGSLRTVEHDFVDLDEADVIDLEHDFRLIGNPVLRLVGGRRQGDEHLASRDALRTRTRLFFTLSAQSFRQTLRSERKGARFSGGGPGA